MTWISEQLRVVLGFRGDACDRCGSLRTCHDDATRIVWIEDIITITVAVLELVRYRKVYGRLGLRWCERQK